MKVISIDPGWEEGTKRNAVVFATPPWRIDCIASGLNDEGVRALVSEWIEPRSLILLDVPVEGCKHLRGHWRPVEKVLQHYLPLYPTSMASTRGPKLKKSLLEILPSTVRSSVTIQEIYPHAVYKFLWAARQKAKLESVMAGEWERILDNGFRQLYPPKYKGRVTCAKRLSGLCQLYELLTEHLGLEGPGFPGDEIRGREMDFLSDEYDACLGTIAGLYYATGNPYARIVGDRNEGDILLLMDMWLAEEIKRVWE